MSERLLIVGGTAVDGGPAHVLVDEGRIVALGPGALAGAGSRTRRLDADGLVVAPGFIDLQVNGAAGVDFTSDPASMWRVGPALARHGVTSFLATILTAPPGAADAAVAAWNDPPAEPAEGALPIGIHLEGPFIAPTRAGAHAVDLVRPPDESESVGWSSDAGVRMVTLAPELPGALRLIATLTARGVVVAAGHSEAGVEAARSGIDAGVRYATHLWNAMAPLDHRRPGLVGAALDDDRVTIGLVADGHHVAPQALRLAWRVAHGRVSIVSDTIAGLDMPRGRHLLGGRAVEIGPEGARLADGTLAGSVSALDAGLRCFEKAVAPDLPDLLATVTSVPARLLGLDDGRGTLRVGGRADLTLLTTDLGVAATLVAGRVAYDSGAPGWA